MLCKNIKIFYYQCSYRLPVVKFQNGSHPTLIHLIIFAVNVSPVRLSGSTFLNFHSSHVSVLASRGRRFRCFQATGTRSCLHVCFFSSSLMQIVVWKLKFFCQMFRVAVQMSFRCFVCPS